jgi:hypothetical protein
MRPNGFVAGGHEGIVALIICFEAAALRRIDEPLLQILCLFPANILICLRVSSFVVFLDILGKDVWELMSQPGWNYCTFPQQNEPFLDGETL